MKLRLLEITLIPLIVLSASACGPKNGSGGNPETSRPRLSSPDAPPDLDTGPWEAQYLAQCPGIDSPTTCAGAYGFHVFSNGTYQVGPGPNGQRFSGALAPKMFHDIRLALQGELASPRDSSECVTPDESQDRVESVQLDYNGNARSSCNSGLLTELRSAVSQYYPPAFPHSCVDANAALEMFYEEAISCERDADCAYVDDQYLPLDPESRNVRSVVIDDCTFISPLVAGNLFTTVTLQKELLLKREQAKRACGDRLKKPSCSEIRFINPWTAPPACSRGRCQWSATQFNFQPMVQS